MAALKSFFDTILRGESKTYNDHNWYTTGSRLRGYIQGQSANTYPLFSKPLSEYSVGEIIQFQNRPRDASGQLWATGRYQIIPKTLLGLVNKHGVSRNLKYDTKLQDFLAYQLLLERRAIKNYIEKKVPDTKENLESAALEVAKIWSSVGVPFQTKGSKRIVQKNESFYAGGGDKSSVKTEDAQAALKLLRNGTISEPQKDENSTNIDVNSGFKFRPEMYVILGGVLLGISGYIYFRFKKQKK